MGIAQSMGASGGGGGAGGFTEKQLKGFAPTRGLQSYTARLLAENATATRPTLQEFAASGGTAKYPIKDTGFTPEEAANLKIVDPRTGLPMPFVSKGQTQLTLAQQIFEGQRRAREGGTGPLAQLGKLSYQQQMLQRRGQTAGVAGAADITQRLGKVGTKLTKAQQRLQSGGGGFPPAK
jgi:hypothetical protein